MPKAPAWSPTGRIRLRSGRAVGDVRTGDPSQSGAKRPQGLFGLLAQLAAIDVDAVGSPASAPRGGALQGLLRTSRATAYERGRAAAAAAARTEGSPPRRRRSGSSPVWPFSPQTIDLSKCMARVWADGVGGQCKSAVVSDDSLCAIHRKKQEGLAGLAHGRLDGPVPENKLAEFRRAQAARARTLALTDVAPVQESASSRKRPRQPAAPPAVSGGLGAGASPRVSKRPASGRAVNPRAEGDDDDDDEFPPTPDDGWVPDPRIAA
eukprot:CAMPEP_0177168746 /NCGR_PEP_ID=MMETSP0367-20130122/9223_1 /TAXON_ID=447022 ORGANISM="Scrippsiella hangoei-like, Strain SHHI-4" /NCGR_SAMPLE_ID=MMETSP0367 /ASSEMBLY_ACC=CAM_ASM_000362 /LENGTH=264 /DNA_ID=CAMNT_0018614885 /DNA_START=58 /DNA_END=849 /DNA_ORIENTATION=-